MPSSAEINSFLDWLHNQYTGSGFVMVPRDLNPVSPWLEEFAYISSDYTTEPVEEPRTGDHLYLVVRNYGLTECTASFQCRVEKGKLTFGDLEAKPLGVDLVAPINPGYDPLPNEEEIAIDVIEENRSRTDHP